MNKVRSLYIFLFVFGITNVSLFSSEQENCNNIGHRIFEGRLEKSSFFASLFKKYKFTLNDKRRCIAFLETKNTNINEEILTKMAKKNVAVRGIAKYVNEEPYLLIDAYDIYIKN